MLLGHARGKVGSLVFSRSNGQQVTRAKADVVKNPQTEAQTIQRIFLNTIAQAYSAMSAIVDHSFEGIPKGQKSMSYFMKRNLNDLRERVGAELAAGAFKDEVYAFTPLGSNVLSVNSYVIAKGSLPEIAVADVEASAYLGVSLPENTYASLIDTYGLQRGDQITFVGVLTTGLGAKVFKFARVILDPRNEDGDELPLTTAFYDAATHLVVSPNPRNEGDLLIGAGATADIINFTFGADWSSAELNNLNAGAVIVSRKNEDGTWMRSNATLLANPSAEQDGFSLQAALDAFANANIELQSSRYLNNAGTGRTAASGTRVRTPRITSASYNGVAITRGAEISAGMGDTAHALSVVCGDLEEGVTYKFGLKAIGGSSVSNKTAITDGEGTLSISEIALSGKELVLLADDAVVDTYCAWVEE